MGLLSVKNILLFFIEIFDLCPNCDLEGHRRLIIALFKAIKWIFMVVRHKVVYKNVYLLPVDVLWG